MASVEHVPEPADVEQLRGIAAALVEQVTDTAASVEAKRTERVRLWNVDRKNAWWRPWHKVDAWCVYEYSTSYTDGTQEATRYLLLASTKRILPDPDSDIPVLLAVNAGLQELVQTLAAARATTDAVPRGEETAEPVTERMFVALDWAAFGRAWRRRDDATLRPEVEKLLGSDAFDLWDGLVRVAIGENEEGPEEAVAEQSARPAAAVRRLLSAADDGDDGPATRAELRALAAAYMYFALLAAWELSDSHAPIDELAKALTAATDKEASGDQDARSDNAVAGAHAITRSIGILARALELQLRCETDLFCSCPVGLKNDADKLVGLLADSGVGADGGGRPPERSIRNEIARLADEVAPQPSTAGLAALIYEEGVHTLTYAEFLQEAARTGSAFVDAMARPTTRCNKSESADFASARRQIEQARSTAIRAIDRLEGSVYASEVRPYLESYSRMLEGLERPSLLVDEGEIVLMYPFGLPNVSTAPHDLVCQLLEPRANRRSPATNRLLRSGILQMPIEARYQATSNTFAVFGSGDDSESAFGARLAFAEHRLMVETTANTRFENIDIDVRLGSYGNHYVRVAFTTEHRTVWVDPAKSYCRVDPECSDGAACLEGPWTAHDVDQWVRRAGLDVGNETVWLEAPGDHRRKRVKYDHLVELVDAIVGDLQRALADDQGEDEANGRGDDSLEQVNDLQANAHVMIVVRRASARDVDGSVRLLETAEGLTDLLGGQALMIPQRGLAPTLEDWIRYDRPDLENLFQGTGHPGDLLFVNCDVTLLCGIASPNWVTLETQDIIEFGTSVIGPLAAWSVWLRRVARRSAITLSNAVGAGDVRGLLEESAWIAKNLGYVQHLIDRLRSAQLMRSRRDRDLLAQFMARAKIQSLEDSLDASINAMIAQRSYSAAQAERLIDDRKKRVDLVAAWMLGILALSGLIGFLAWVGRGWEWSDPQRNVFDVAILAAAAIILVTARLEWSARHETYSRRATFWVIGALVAILGLLWLFRADNDWPWKWTRDGWFDVIIGSVVVTGLVVLALVLLVKNVRPRPRRRARP